MESWRNSRSPVRLEMSEQRGVQEMRSEGRHLSDGLATMVRSLDLF